MRNDLGVRVLAIETSTDAALVMTPGWRKSILARRDGPPVVIKPVDDQAVTRIRTAIFDTPRRDVLAMLDYRGAKPEFAAAGRRFIDFRRKSAKDTPDTVGAGVIAYLNLARDVTAADFADFWIAEFGLDYAVRAAVDFVEVRGVFLIWSSDDFPVRDWTHGGSRPFGVALRLRERLTLVGPAEYAGAMRSIQSMRRTPRQKCAAAFMFPTNEEWVADACRVPTGLIADRSRLELLTSVSSTDMVSNLLFVNTGWDSHYQDYRRILPTLIDRFGDAMVPILAKVLAGHLSTERAGHVAEALACLPGEDAFKLLLAFASRAGVRPAITRATRNFPERSQRVLAAMDTPLARELSAISGGEQPCTAAPDRHAQLPALLAKPPWEGKRTAVALPRVRNRLRVPSPKLSWTPDELARARNFENRFFGRRSWAEIENGCREGGFGFAEALINGPDALVERVLSSRWAPHHVYSDAWWFPAATLRVGPSIGWLATTFAEKSRSGDPRGYVGPILSDEVVTCVARWLSGQRRSLIAVARAYLDRHGVDAAPYLLNAASETSGARRDEAHRALRYIARNSSRAAVIGAVGACDPDAVALVTAILDVDPLHLLPKRIPPLPHWARPALETPVRTVDGVALPHGAVESIVVMLMMSGPIQPYAGVDELRTLCDVMSLNELSWALFEAWWKFGAPSAHRWALDALAWFADESSVDRIADMIKSWPGQGRSGRVPHGLDVLSTIGTDHALLTLFRLSKKGRSKPLKDKAAERLTEIAVARGLSDDQLADRLIPDLDLGETGAAEFDYGSRKFTLEFDELLRPQIRDESGAPLRSMPKPGKRDDPELAEDAYRRFAQVKREVRVVAKEQLPRLETAMIHERSWSVEEFELVFVRHPVMVQLARRLVWLQFDGDSVRSTFRIAEDCSYASSDDDAVDLDGRLSVGIAHPLQVADRLASWSAVFADYEILQPFAQIGRQVTVADDADLVHADLKRFDGAEASTFALMGLGSRGWTLEEPISAGIRSEISRPAPKGRRVSISLHPGIPPDPREVETQTFTVTTGQGSFGELGRIFTSEVITDMLGVMNR